MGRLRGSDLDLAVLLSELADPVLLWESTQQIAAKAGKNVDLVDLQLASTVMRAQVINTGQWVLTIDENACQQFEMLALSMYLRFNEERKEILE